MSSRTIRTVLAALALTIAAGVPQAASADQCNRPELRDACKLVKDVICVIQNRCI